MIPERDYFMAQDEVRRRQREAAQERAAREARQGQARDDEPAHSAFSWLRRLAGAPERATPRGRPARERHSL